MIPPVEIGFLALMNVNADLYNIAPTLSKKPDPQNTEFTIHTETSLSNSSRHADAFPLTDGHESSSLSKASTR